ncbi:hypothetical protein INQ25_02305 [Wolbachia endosymbiont of Rhagoletis cerasi]|nr:hypothetical protein [Wolbachia endosymbiont of Rhagoletis cerasi]MBS9530234.1 hypothetical protein [Wolbachia endosymbiont of Rhagoletis cerasi]
MLTVAIGCFAANVGLSMLVIAGIAVAAALAVGTVAGSITYVVSKPGNELNEISINEKTFVRQPTYSG